MDSTVPPRVVIIGGGFSGTALSIRLLESSPHLKITLIEKKPTPGEGLAYGTSDRGHLLNVPAKRMSLHGAKPNHFVEWLANKGFADAKEIFAPRTLYAEYLRSSLQEVQKRGSFHLIHDEVVRVERGFRIELKTGNHL